MQVSKRLSNIAFYLQPILLQTLAAINSGSCQRISRDRFQAFCVLSSEVTVLFDWNLNALFLDSRQWPEVYDSCHTFLHVARVRKHTDMRELHAFCVQFSCNSRMSVYFLTRTTCKNVRQNLILRATAYFPQLWQQGDETPCSSLAILRDFEPLSALIRALLYCFALYNFLLLGFRQWRSRADRVSALDINV